MAARFDDDMKACICITTKEKPAKRNGTRTPQELAKGRATPLRFEFSYE